MIAEEVPAGSTPSVSNFDPNVIPYQFDVIRDIRSKYDYSLGTHEVLLSGSVGSAKSILMAHLVVTHCLMFANARAVLCRRSMPDLKDTILQKVIDHLTCTPELVEGVHWIHNITKGSVHFSNGSEIISRSWADKKFTKFRSIEASFAAVEELTENDDTDKKFYPELMMRIGRLPHVPENVVVCATNPDDPAHWVYKHFIESKIPTRHVYYSLTEQNPFLPKKYIEHLQRTMDPKLARRMLRGEWISINQDGIYYAYTDEKNYRDIEYTPNPRHAIHITWDFNIGQGKPMSAVCFQNIGGEFHFFNEVVIHTANTLEVLEEYAARGLFEFSHFIINGDRNGKNKDTRSNRTDYEIIEQFIRAYVQKKGTRPIVTTNVPLSNPGLRPRHNRTNALMCNTQGVARVFVYKSAQTLRTGWKLTAFKKGGQYVEDDSKEYQHVTTAAGYGIMAETGEQEEIHTFDRWTQWKF